MYVIDIAANRYIINDSKMMTNIQMCKASIKGIGGEATVIKGVGNIAIGLETDDGRCDNIVIHDAVYVPTYPYNLIPPPPTPYYQNQNSRLYSGIFLSQ